MYLRILVRTYSVRMYGQEPASYKVNVELQMG